MHLDSLQRTDLGLFLLRGVLGVVFAFHGAQKLLGWFGGYGIQGTAGFFESIGIPFPVLSTWMAGGTELFGGLFLLAGVLTVPSGLLLAFTMAVASVTAHSGFAAAGGGFEFTLTLGVAALALALVGPGRYRIPGPSYRTARATEVAA